MNAARIAQTAQAKSFEDKRIGRAEANVAGAAFSSHAAAMACLRSRQKRDR
jgi:hypothetical protein